MCPTYKWLKAMRLSEYLPSGKACTGGPASFLQRLVQRRASAFKPSPRLRRRRRKLQARQKSHRVIQQMHLSFTLIPTKVYMCSLAHAGGQASFPQRLVQKRASAFKPSPRLRRRGRKLQTRQESHRMIKKKRCIYVLTLCDDYVLTYLHMQDVKPPSPAWAFKSKATAQWRRARRRASAQQSPRLRLRRRKL